MRKKVNRYKKSPFKQGIYRPVNRQKYIGARLPEYRSSWELKFFTWCDRNSNVLEWTSESTIVPYISPLDNKVHRYFVDFYMEVKDENGSRKSYLVEVKPKRFTSPPKPGKRKTKRYLQEIANYAVNEAKWKTAKLFCKKQGMEFRIVTEKELGI